MQTEAIIKGQPGGDGGERETLIRTHAGLVRRIALGFAARVPPSVELQVLLGAGFLGLLDAVDKFEGARSVPFEAYARMRIQGAIQDSLRAGDRLSRRERRCGREADRAEEKLTRTVGRELSADEASEVRGGVPRMLRQTEAFVALEDAHERVLASEEDVFSMVAAAEQREQLRAALGALSERDRTILSLYYEEELSYREIGGMIGVSESRICQIVGGLHRKLRDEFAQAA